MRKQLCEALLKRASSRAEMIFLTGDLGFMALEPLQAEMGQRFINAGIAEQNMISVAAGLAKEGLEPWVYSIAPFCYARPFEQIRNDVAFHDLPVRIIGNGGGYGYGVMGPTHHAIEDYGVLLTLPNVNVFIPAFDEDMHDVIVRAGACLGPVYIRIGRGELPQGIDAPAYAPWRQLTVGGGPVVIVVGPLAGLYIEAFNAIPISNRPNLWVVAELPLSKNSLPFSLKEQIKNASVLCVAEEHVRHSGFGSDLLLYLVEEEIRIPTFRHLFAQAHHFDRYGSQGFLRKCSQLDLESMLKLITE